MPIDPKLLEELKAKHGPDQVVQLRACGVEVVVRKPRRVDYKRFRDHRADSRKATMALELLFEACLLHPSKDSLDPDLEAHPALADTFGVKLVELAGGNEEAEVKN